MIVYTPDDVAKLLRITKKTVYKLINSRELAALRVGSLFRITEQQLQSYLSSTKRHQ